MAGCLKRGWLVTAALTVAVLSLTYGQFQDEMNECSRGVRRSHPTQENIYQVFVRNGWRTDWLDRSCPRYHVYDHILCGCVETLGHPSTTNKTPLPTKPPVTFPMTKPPTPQVVTRVYPPISTVLDKISYEVVDTEKQAVKPVRCNIHQPLPGDRSKYQRLTSNGWTTEDCNWPFYTGLVWDQSSCRCEWGPNRTEPVLQEQPLAVPSLCLVMLNMTFDQKIKDDMRDLWLSQSDVDNIAVVREPGSVGGASALFRSAYLTVPFFKSNTLGNLFHVSLRFKPCSEGADTDLILLHNGCPDLGLPPSLSLAYRAWTHVLIVEFDTQDVGGPLREECEISNQVSGSWTDISVHYQGGRLDVIVNGRMCISSSSHSGDVRPTDCQLTIPGEDFCGYLDEVVISRGCSNTLK